MQCKNDGVATINGGFSIINQLKVDFNGINVIDNPGINHATNVKNMTEYSKDYSIFHDPDTSTHVDYKVSIYIEKK